MWKVRKIGSWIGLAGVLLLAASPVLAQQVDTVNGANTAWIMTSTALVLFMTLPGLALFYGGLVQAKNVLSVLMHCFAIACLISVMWLVFLYSFAFGDGGSANAVYGGFGKAFLWGVGTGTLSGDIPETVFFMFQMTFAIITPALIVGAFVERMKFSEVKGYGRQKGHKEIYRGSEYTVNFVPKIKIEVAVNDDVAERAVQGIQESARTDQIGDGKIFVLPMHEAVRIRTGETGANAL